MCLRNVVAGPAAHKPPERAQQHARLGEEGHQRNHHHTGHARPQGPQGDAREPIVALGVGRDVADVDHHRRQDGVIEHGPDHHPGPGSDAHQSASAQQRYFDRRRDVQLPQLGQERFAHQVEEVLGQVPDFLEAQQALLPQAVNAAGLQELDEGGAARGDGQDFGLHQAQRGVRGVQGVHDHARRLALGERVLLVVNEPALEGKGEQHAEHRDDDVPRHDLPPRQERVGDDHVGRQRRDQRRGHVAGRGSDRLHGVVFQDREFLGPADA